MSNTILIKRSGTANSVPLTGDLSLGELAINYTDGNLFYKDGGGTINLLVSNKFVSVTGNITGGNLNATGLSLSGNVVSAINSTSNITTTGNITGGYIFGNIANATGYSASKIYNGLSEVNIGTANGNANISIAGTSNVVVVTTTGVNVTGTVSASANVTGGNLISSGDISATSATNVRFGAATTLFSGHTTLNANGVYVANTTGTQIIQVSTDGVGNGIAIGTDGTANSSILSTGGIEFAVDGTLVANGLPGAGNLIASISSTGVEVVGLISASGNVTGANLVTAGNVFAPAIIANTSTYDTRVSLNSAAGIVEITSAGNSTQFGPGGVITLAGASQIQGGTFGGSGFTAGASQTDIFQNRGGNVTVQVGTGGTIASTWTFAQGGNLLAPGAVSAVGNIIGGNVNATGLSLSGNVVSALVSAANITTTANIAANYFIGNGSLLTGIDATSIQNGNSNVKVYANANVATSVNGVANVLVVTSTGINITGTASANGNVTGGNLITAGDVSAASTSASGNITGGNLITAGAVSAASTSASGNVTGGNLITAGAVSAASVSASGNITGGNIITSGASGNISGANVISGTTLSATANIIGGNLITSAAVSAASVSASANITGGNLITAGAVSAASVSASANVTGGNINTAGLVTTANINSATTLTLTTGAGDINLWPTAGNIHLANTYINHVATPVQAFDAATKQYVDDAVSTGITIHTPVYVESPTALAATYAQGGTTHTVTDITGNTTLTFSATHSLNVNDQIYWGSTFNGITANTSYFVYSAPTNTQITLANIYGGPQLTNLTNGTGLSQVGRANPGVGATLTANVNGAANIDGVLVTSSQRVLIYTQTNAAQNGVYVVTNTGNVSAPWQFTRSSDTNTYQPDSINGLDAGDYFFVQAGDTGAGESYVLTAPVGELILGYDNLTFTQFSASKAYSAGNGLTLTGTVFSVNVDNDTTAISGGNVIVKAGANLVTPNIGAATGSSLSVTGNVTGGNLNAVSLSLSGNVISAINTIANITTTADISGGNIITAGLISVGGNITGANVISATTLSASANIVGGNLNAAGLSLSGNVLSPLNVTGNITGGNVNGVNGVYSGGVQVLTINDTVDGGTY